MKRFFLLVYFLSLLLLALYSYALVDPNLTLFNNPIWTSFRNYMVNLGYYQRDLSANIYLSLIVILFIFYGYYIANYKRINLLLIIIPIFFIAILSYPFLSHDFFNYMFDAKILTFYHQNPYLHKALDYPLDPWIRFMHWTHRTYPYGPTFLLITIIPSFLSFGKFILSFFLFKLTNFIFYFISVYLLAKLNKKWAIIFAVSPLVIIEGLINGHNDLIGVSLAIIGIYYLLKKNDKLGLLGRLILLVSGGIKYITLPLIFLVKKDNCHSGKRTKRAHPESMVRSNQGSWTSQDDVRYISIINNLVFIGLLLILGYLSFKMEIQPWYFLTLFAFLPFYEKLILNLNIFFAGLLFSYYPFIKFGEWNQFTVNFKHQIIIFFLILNILIYFLRLFYKNKKIFVFRF